MKIILILFVLNRAIFSPYGHGVESFLHTIHHLSRPTNNDIREKSTIFHSSTCDATSKLFSALPSVYLFSLRYPTEDSFSKPVKDIWRWKDSVLGDGRDFFVPKPQTLTALNQNIMDMSSSFGINIKECSVLSNCARFEIILVVRNDGDETEEITSSKRRKEKIKEILSCCLYKQVNFHQNKPFPFLRDQFARFDSSSLIDQSIDIKKDENAEEDLSRVKEIMSYWTNISSVENVCHHLCVVAAGMAKRPNRPEREVPFRPFSSRDAHIMLQLKRTREVSLGDDNNNVLQRLFDSALSAGKASRNVQQVSELKSLQKYGSGNNNKYSVDPPAALTERVADAAIRIAIEPTVKNCVESFSARSKSTLISKLRSEMEQMANSSEEEKWIRRQLHQPTVDLRKGIDIDIDATKQIIKEQLLERRQQKKIKETV